jgi:hypothetical protein
LIEDHAKKEGSKPSNTENRVKQRHGDSDVGGVLDALLKEYQTQSSNQDRWEHERIWWTRLTFWGLVASTLVSGLALGAAVIGNMINHDNFVATQRPWISVLSKIAGPLDISADGISLPFSVEINNNGHSPAQKVALRFGLMLVGGAIYPSPSIAQDAICNTNYSDAITLSVFPDNPIPGFVVEKLTPEGINTEFQGISESNSLEIVFAGCVKYDFSTSRGSGETGVTL